MAKNKCKTKKCRTSIGGQAVLEGVMMRGASSMAIAVRDEDGIIRTESKRISNKKPWIFKVPVFRGVYSFISSLVTGVQTLMRSAEVYGEAEPTKFEKWLSKTFKVNLMSVVTFLGIFLGLALAIGLFIVLPQEARKLIERIADYEFGIVARNFIEGGFKILIFVIYILLVTLFKDIRRTFMYHGAEHKTITCYEKGLDLTVENAKKCRRVHDRCGTTFMFFVIFVSILVFAGFEAILGHFGVTFGGGFLGRLLRVLCKIALLPLVAGLSYELLKGLSKTDLWIFYPLKVPGLLIQRITTKEPDEKMLEVAITAFKTVLAMDADPTIKEVKFITAKKRSEIYKDVKQRLYDGGIIEDSENEARWIIALTLNIKNTEVNTDNLVTPKYVEIIDKIVNERLTGKPLWYVIGDTEFIDYKIIVNENVLIPRPETELLAEEVFKISNENTSVLDLCTGSGCIALSINKKTGAIVTASDISNDALKVAKANAEINGAKVEFILSDMFNNLQGRTFDVIVSNPPYVMTEEIASLQPEVKNFEPHLALDGGEDGLDFYRIIAEKAPDFLNKNGTLLLECGENQAEDIVKLLSDSFINIEVIKDYSGIDRIIKAVKNV